MYTSLAYHSSFAAFLNLINLPYGLAKPQQGLPHEIMNMTVADTVHTPMPIAEPALDNTSLITTESWSHPWLCGAAAPTSTSTIYSLIIPSPDASPVEVTAQSQVVTSFLPQMTWCAAPAIALSAISIVPFMNGTTSYTTISDTSSNCETVYAPIETTVCATTLTGLASKVTITECDQEVTFSTECGFTLETPTPITTSNSSLITPAPTVRRMYTYWLAPWQSLTAGDTPSDVDVKICTVLDDGDLECIRYQEVWEVVLVTTTTTSLRTFDFTATVSGPGTVHVETLQAYITDKIETLALSTTLLLETEIETESTSIGRKSSTDLDTIFGTSTSTLFITKTLMHAPTSSSLSIETSEPITPEPTTTIRLTSYVNHTMTTTVRRPRPRLSATMAELAAEDF